MKEILIIKLGYTETLDSSAGTYTSLGDVFRTTVLLHFFKRCRVSWLVDRVAVPLLAGNPRISEIIVYGEKNMARLRGRRFDTVVNLERQEDIFALCETLSCRRFFGFRKEQGAVVSACARLLKLSGDPLSRRRNRECWQKVLVRAIGEEWNGEPYLLGYEPKGKVCVDVGFNWATSVKWENKAWPRERWEELERRIGAGHSVSWQKGLKSLREYMDWIHSCRVIVTADSLGLHLALAMGKRVVALFGPTPAHEVYLYGAGTCLYPFPRRSCMPCLRPSCGSGYGCIGRISPSRVARAVEKELGHAG